MDSVVLLHLLHQLAPNSQWRLSALHVHHGISPNAGEWAGFCTDLCLRYSIPLHVEHVDVAPLRDEHGIEAAARKLRYAAFARQPCDFVALAHHADDQVETLLLQLMRGAGLKGAAAMPVLSRVEGPVLSEVKGPLFKPGATHAAILRPLLDIPRSKLLDYAHQHSLRWVEDESNADDRYPRNFLRHRLLPLLEQRFPAYRDTLTRSARHFAEAGELLDELAQQDMQGLEGDGWLEIALLRELSCSRARNLLRYWLNKQGAPMPQAVELEEILRQLLDARAGAAVCVEFGDWQVRRYQDRVYVLRALGKFEQGLILPWHGEAEMEWPPLNGKLVFTRAMGQGISLAKLQGSRVSLRLRSGGETLRPYPKAATRSLKNLLQEHHVPPWQRERLPLLYSGETLVCVVGVAVAASFQASADEPGVVVA